MANLAGLEPKLNRLQQGTGEVIRDRATSTNRGVWEGGWTSGDSEGGVAVCSLP